MIFLIHNFPIFVVVFFPPALSSFTIAYKANIMILNHFSFYLSGKIFISSSNLNNYIAG